MSLLTHGQTSQDSKDVAEADADKFSEENTNTEHVEDGQVIRRFVESVSSVQKSLTSHSFLSMRLEAMQQFAADCRTWRRR